MGAKDIYYSLEDKWYALIDKIDARIPISGIVDKVDSVVPSFALFLIILILIILFIGMNTFTLLQPYTATFQITDYKGTAVYDSVINYSVLGNGTVIREETLRTNDNGEIKITDLSNGQEIKFNINLSTGTSDDSFIIDKKEYYEIIKLKQKIDLKPIERTILLQHNFATIQEPINVELFCENPSVKPTPTSATSINGIIQVTEPVNCSRLYAKVIDDKYENKQYHINSSTYQLILTKKELPKVNLKIKLQENGLPVNAGFNIRLNGENTYTRMSSTSTETFEVIPGEYLLSVSDPNKNYGSVSKTIIVNSNKEEVIEVSKSIKATINVTILDEITGMAIEDAIVSLKNEAKRLVEDERTDASGKASFALTTLGTFYVSAKKVGGIEEGYFAKEIKLENITSNVNITLELESITEENAGRVIVTAKDQDGEAVANAQIYLKYEKDDTLVELNEENNYVLTDINGEATFLAGKVEGKAYAYATKYPFNGKSQSKIISLDEETTFTVEMQVGQTTIKINAVDEKGEKINGEARIFNMKNQEESGLLFVENGLAQTTIKAGKTIYLAVSSENHETYYSQPIFLMPNKTETFDVILQSEITEPSIVPNGRLEIYNEQGQIVRTMKSGNKYYALLEVQADQEYDEVLVHFRAGKEELLENDYIEIDTVEAAGYFTETRGKSYSPERGYSYDSENLTDGLAKWVTINFENFTKGTHLIKINFRLKKNTPSNKELQFFWRANFDGTKKPASNADEELYDETYASNVYFEGEEAICNEDFCIMSEWLYDETEDLYTDDMTIEQVKKYTYHYQIINNSNTDYGKTEKRIALGLEMLSQDGEGAKIISYEIKGPADELSGGKITKITDYEITSFEKSTAIDVTLRLEGNKQGNSTLRTHLKSDGRIIFTDDETFSVPNEKNLSVSLNKNFVPALIDTEIIVDVRDDKGEILNEAFVNVFAKENGFDEYLVQETLTNRLGKATIYTGAHFPGTKVIIEVAKQGFTRLRLELIVSENVVAFNPSNLGIQLNTITKRESVEEVEAGNATGKELEIYSVKPVAQFQGAINEAALKSHFDGLRGNTIQAEGTTDIDIVRIRLDNGLTEDTMLEPINVNGTIIVTLKPKNTSVVFDVLLPFNLNITSGANTEASCLIVSNAVQTGVTERGKISFRFDLLNACQDQETGTNISIEELTASSTNEIQGAAELSLQSYTTANGGRTALDSLERKVYGKLNGGEKLSGTLTYTPNTDAIGKTINIPVTIKGKFQGQTITTNPSQLKFTVDVINLKECMSIDSDSSPVAFDEETTVSVDASACLGQKINVWLCKNDAGCHGGVEGKISLGKTQFNLQNNSETITIRSSDLPGSYGVSVWARIEGKSSWTYIGEVPVAFREPDGKFFSLSKYELNIVGDGMQDSMLLTNKMLDHTVKVRATNKIWGNKAPEINWMQVVAGAAIGASLGHMIGGGFESGSSPTQEQKREQNEAGKNQTGAEESAKLSSTGQIQEQIHAGFADDSGWVSGAEFVRSDGTIVESGTDNVNDTISYKNITINGDTVTLVKRTYTPIGMDSSYTQEGIIYRGTYNYSPDASQVVSASILQNTSGFTGLRNSLWGKSGAETGASVSTGNQNSGLSPAPEQPKISFSSFNMPALDWKPEKNNDAPKISFGAIQGWSTVVGAIVGALAAWYMQEQAKEAFLKEFQTANYRDYVIFLQGETISVTSPSGEISEERSIPSDAGALNFTLGGVSASWDFSNADYSTEEHVGIRMTNTGLNDTKPRYGTLTINATTHKHGSAPIYLDERTSEAEYDVTCNNANFGQYWIGAEEEAGLCTGVSTGTYSQKYHIRVISGEPQDEEAKIVKSTTCYNGTLTGATGRDAVPRVKFEWDWQDMKIDMCDYGNPDYVYCDGVQFTATAVKKLAALQEFFRLNPSTVCPEDPILESAMEEFEEINAITEIVAAGYIGIEDVEISIDMDNEATATLTINNLTGAPVTTYISSVWKGKGEPANDLIQQEFPVGESTIEFTATTPEWDDVYFFSAVANGPSGNRRTITRAFTNLPGDMPCWAKKTTRSIGGIPSIMYFLVDDTQLQWTQKIPDSQTLYNFINSGAYLIRENYSDDLFADVSDYYLNRAFEVISEDEKKLLEKIASQDFSIVKRFTEQSSIEAGLYDVYFNIDFQNDFDILEEGNEVETSLLLIRPPFQDNPLYRMPFDGLVGQQRMNYGTTYSNETDTELKINNTISTKYNASSNGVVDVRTNYITSFEQTNSSLGTRGQLAIINHNGSTADMTFSPNYATPVIGRYALSGTNGKFTFNLEKSYSPVITGGNLSYWTGAARSKDFFGGNASEVYNNTPDSLIDDDYGFSWDNATENGTLYLKSVFYSPVKDYYVLRTENGSFWTPNSNFSSQAELLGISGMKFNQDGDYFETLEDLFTMVTNQDVCISNDGTTMSFWWNPKVIENTRGSQSSLAEKELSLVGS